MTSHKGVVRKPVIKNKTPHRAKRVVWQSPFHGVVTGPWFNIL